MRILAPLAALCLFASGCATGPAQNDGDRLRTELIDLAKSVQASSEAASKQAAEKGDAAAKAKADRYAAVASIIANSLTDPASAIAALTAQIKDPLVAGIAQYALLKLQEYQTAQKAAEALAAPAK